MQGLLHLFARRGQEGPLGVSLHLTKLSLIQLDTFLVQQLQYLIMITAWPLKVGSLSHPRSLWVPITVQWAQASFFLIPSLDQWYQVVLQPNRLIAIRGAMAQGKATSAKSCYLTCSMPEIGGKQLTHLLLSKAISLPNKVSGTRMEGNHLSIYKEVRHTMTQPHGLTCNLIFQGFSLITWETFLKRLMHTSGVMS